MTLRHRFDQAGARRARSLSERMVVLAMAVLVSLAAPAGATTIFRQPVRCPACDHAFTSHQIGSTNTFGGKDSDFCAHARGTPSLLYVLVTCVKCLFTGYASEFKPDSKDEAENKAAHERFKPLSKEFMEKFKGGAALTPMKPLTGITEYREIPAFMRFQLMAQIAELRGDGDQAIAELLQRGAWAVRLDAPPLPDLLEQAEMVEFKSFMEREYPKRVEGKNANPSFIDVELGELLLSELEAMVAATTHPPVSSAVRMRAYMGFQMLRRHGENPKAMRCLQFLQPHLNREIWDQLYDRVSSSVLQEQAFQKNLVEILTRMAAAEHSPEAKLILTYRIGETQRRLGRLDEAKAAFAQVRAGLKNLPEGFAHWLAFVEAR
jgi:hypothetical protein